MSDPLNRELQTTPAVVPASFSPAPEKYERQVGQELRARQAQLGQGYTLKQVNYLEIQQHRAPYKRDAVWQTASPEEMDHTIKVAKTARTLMLQDVPLWAGSLDEDELQNALPNIWNEYIQRVVNETSPAASNERFISGAGQDIPVETPEDTPDLGDDTPIQVIFRPTIPEDAPKSQVTPPEQLSLGDVLAKIAAGTKK